MGLFNKNKIKVRKDDKGDRTRYYVDYHRIKEAEKFKSSLIRDLIGENQSLIVINTNLIYKNDGISIEKKVEGVMNLLDEQGISYRKIVTENTTSPTILGVPLKINSKVKVKSYILGFVIRSEDFKRIGNIVDNFNINYYVVSKDIPTEELINQFNATRGDIDELKDIYDFNLYNDNFFQVISISPNVEYKEFIDEVLRGYIEKESAYK